MRKLTDNKTLALNAKKSISIENLEISGSYGLNANSKRLNAKILLNAPVIKLGDCEVKDMAASNKVYNVFEQSSTGAAIRRVSAKNIKVSDPTLGHNVFNFYKFENGASVKIYNCDFDLTVDNSNIMRLSNIGNATDVTITFENVNWTYENSTSKNYAGWAGLVLFQPWPNAQDAAYAGDYTALKSWKFEFINCKYNGEPITAENVKFGIEDGSEDLGQLACWSTKGDVADMSFNEVGWNVVIK